MPLFAKESMKRLPPKLRQMIRGQQEDVVRSEDSGRPLSRGGKSLSSTHRHVDQDERAVGGRKSRAGSRPGSAIGGRRRGGAPSADKEKVLSGADAELAVEELLANDGRQLRRTSSAPIIGDADKAKLKRQQQAISRNNALGSKSAAASPKAGQQVALADSKMAARLLGGIGSLKRSGTARQLTRRRSANSLGKTGGRRGSMSKQRREQARRDERRAMQAKLRSVLGKMTHRKISSGWSGWLKYVEDHRYRDVASAAQSVLMHIQPEQRNPNDVKQVATWLQHMKLECLRPLTEGIHKFETSGSDDNSGGGRGRSASIEDPDKTSAKPGGGGDGGQKVPIHGGADDSLLQVLCRRASLRKYKKGEVMFWQTDFGDHYHVVLTGQVGIYANSKRALAAKLAKEAKAEADRHSDAHDHPNSYLDWSPSVPARNRLLGRWICNYNVGGAFGELALVSWDRERKASAIANEDDTMVLLVDRWSYNKCLWHLHQATHNLDDRIAWLKNTDHFSVWNHHRLAHFAYALKEKNFNRGDIIVREGDSAQQLILLKSGVVQSYVHRKDSITGKPKLLRLATYSEGTFLGETDLGGSMSSSGGKRTQSMTIRAMSSATNHQVTCYYVPRDTYSKFVVRNTDAATALLRRQLVLLSQARRSHIEEMDRRFEVKERVASASRRVRVTRSAQLREIETSRCGQAPVGMPQNVRVMFGKVLLSMTPEDQANVLASCAWSKATDLTDAEVAIQKESTSIAQEQPETLGGDINHVMVGGGLALRPQTSPMKSSRRHRGSNAAQISSGPLIDVAAEKSKRREKKKAADVNGVQYGRSRHAVDDDDMWGLLSDTAVLTTSISTARTSGPSSPDHGSQTRRPRKVSPAKRLSPIRRRGAARSPLKRPSTAPNVNPFGLDSRSRRELRLPGTLSVGLSSPSFYGGRLAVAAIKKKIIKGEEEVSLSESTLAAKTINDKLEATSKAEVMTTAVALALKTNGGEGFFPTAVSQ